VNGIDAGRGEGSASSTDVDQSAVHHRVAAAFTALDDAGVVWALVRGAEDLARPTGDVDLLVERSAVRRLDAVLAAAGLRRLGVRGHGSHRFYFAYEAADALWIKLDVVTEIEFGRHQELTSSLASGALQRRERRAGIWRLSPADEAWLVLLHLLLDKGEVAADRREVALAAVERAPLTAPLAVHLDQRLGAGTAAGVLDTIRAGDTARSRSLAGELARRWAGARRPVVLARRFAGRVVRHLDLTVPGHPAGTVVAIVGPDGAGKTTLSSSLRRSFPTSTRAVYMGLWRESRWDDVLRSVPGGRLGHRIGRLLRASVAAHAHRLLGRLVLLDRFPQDVLLPGDVDTSLGGRVIGSLAQRLGPDPDLVLVLDAPGELLFARKGEHDPVLLEERRQGYLRLADRFRASVVLDATQPAAAVLAAAVSAIWSRFSPPPAGSVPGPAADSQP
jgi:thymidylate kinase